jgi:hypothetical protein
MTYNDVSGPNATTAPLWEEEGAVRRFYRESVSFVFHGDSVDDGTIPMADYGKAVMGYATMLHEAVRAIDPRADIPDVRITYQDRGSFVTGVSVGVSLTLSQSIIDCLSGPTGQALANGATTTLFVSGVIGGAIKLVQLLHGRTIADRKKTSHTHEDIILSDGTVTNQPSIIVNLTVNNSFRGGVRDFIQPTFSQGVENVTINAGGHQYAALERSDRQWFDSLEKNEEESWSEELRLKILSVSFDDKQWRFEAIPQDGPTYTFRALMLDEIFADRIALNDVRFQDGDEIDALVNITVYRERHARRSYEILKVNEIHHRPQTAPLFEQF